MHYYLSFGLIMGLTAGLSPGPLLTLVITETLQHGIRAGMKIALAPIITDAPIVIVMLLVVGQLSEFNYFIGTLSLMGGSYVLYMAFESARSKEPANNRTDNKSKSLTKGVLANALSPHPYMFWLAVGAPTIIKSTSVSSIAPVIFICGFYLPMIGSKVILATLVEKYKTLLNGESYKNVMRCLSVLLGIFGILLLIDGLKLIGIT